MGETDKAEGLFRSWLAADPRWGFGWIGWAAWVAKLEEVGIHVPEDKRTDAEFLLQLSLETPKFYGPARGLPRNREPLLHLIRNTTLMKDYEVVGDMTLDAVRTIQTPTLLVYGRESHFISSYDFLHKTLPNCKPVLLPGGEHFGPLEQPELLTEHIQQFLKRPAPVSSLPPVSFGDERAMGAAL